MSESMTATEAGSTAADAGSNAGSYFSAVPGNTANIGEAGTGAGVVAQQASPGWGLGPDTVQGLNADQASNLGTYGSVNPSWMEKAYGMYDRFTKGGNMSFPEAYKAYQGGEFGNNPETYGFIYNKLGQVARMGGGGMQPMQPASINVSYQQPDNPYLRKRGY